jgi:hypothetical protein
MTEKKAREKEREREDDRRMDSQVENLNKESKIKSE